MRLSDTSLISTLNRLDKIGATIQRTNFRDYISELRTIVALFEYYAQPQEGVGPPTTQFFGPQVKCEECEKTWATPDACLLHLNGRWLCRDHHPPLNDGGIRPPGYQPPAAERAALEENRRAVRAKLTREELRYINTRIGG